MAMRGLASLAEQAGAKPVVFNLAAPGSRTNPAYHWRRARRAAAAALALVQERRLRGDPVRVHIGCDGGAGLLYAMALAVAARLAGCSLAFHHHSHIAPDRRRPLLAALLKLGGQQAVHVALRRPMADALRQRYGRSLRLTTLSNAAFIEPAAMVEIMDSARAGRPLVIGMISNLSPAKGLDLFLALAGALAAQHGVRCLLAGPVASQKDRMAIDQSVAAGEVTWLGPVDGAAKSAFYQQIDLLVFPSRYANEAEPLVVLEAMAQGVPVLATDRGCIRDLVGDAGVVLASESHFVPHALELIGTIRADPAWLPAHRRNALRRFRRERATALAQAARLLGAPPLAPAPVEMDGHHG
ncbi:glycosyltransferase family 4 protein [Camelimonas sp. ID_303_24]